VPANLEPVLTLLLVAVLANLIVMGVVLIPPMIGRRSLLPTGRPDPSDPVAVEHAAATGDPVVPAPGTVPAGAYDRVVRIVSWVFILATFMIVAVTGLWPDSQLAIFALLAFAGVFVLVVHDLMPPRSLGTAKFIVEGSVAITFATLLVLLTGAENSPFFFTFPLIVGGAALVVSPRITFGLAAIASLGYIFATALPPGPVEPVTVAKVGINLTALVLLAYVATVIAREQRVARDAAVRLSTVDPLTSLYNRTYFFAAVDREIARSLRTDRGFCVLMMDLDELKTINDRYGHYFGDQVIRGVGDVISSGVRKIDTAARYGGDEFVVLLPETDPTGAWVLAEKVRIGVNELEISVAGTDIPASISVGVVNFPDDGRTADALLISADQAMYASKRAGKNRVMGFPVANTEGADQPV
jgi:diguanylate cyclase (GGDEF)-like protein